MYQVNMVRLLVFLGWPYVGSGQWYSCSSHLSQLHQGCMRPPVVVVPLAGGMSLGERLTLRLTGCDGWM